MLAHYKVVLARYMMAINRMFTNFSLWMLARRIESGWISPNQTVTQFDSRVILTCYSEHSLPAEWWFSHNESRAVAIYLDRIIQPRWRGKYDIITGSNFYNLSIVSVTLDNDGRYECREGSGVRNTQWHTLYLHINDFDECMMKKSSCSQYANCTNTVGSFSCTCQDGFKGNGYEWNDVNECAAEINGGCTENSYCMNIMGSFSCLCDEGFQRSGSQCIKTGMSSRAWIVVVFVIVVVLVIAMVVWKMRRTLKGWCRKIVGKHPEQDPLLTVDRGQIGVECVAVLNEYVCAIYSSQRWIGVYDGNTLDFVRRIDIGGHNEQHLGMTSRPDLNCLFVSNFLDGSIHRFDLKNENKVSVEIGQNSSPIGLSMTGDGYVLVTCGGWKCLKLYSSKLKLIDTIGLERANPEYAVEVTGRKQYAVCHKEPESKVVIINDVGAIVIELNEFSSVDPLNCSILNGPRGVVAVDSSRILVADVKLSVIVLYDLNDETRKGKVVVGSDRVGYPQTLSWNGENSQLYVGEFKRGGIVRLVKNVVGCSSSQQQSSATVDEEVDVNDGVGSVMVTSQSQGLNR